MTDDRFRCICDPDDLFEPPNPTPVAVEGCSAHRFRCTAQQFARQVEAREAAVTAAHRASLAAEKETP